MTIINVQVSKSVACDRGDDMTWNIEKSLRVYRTVFPDDRIYHGKGDPREKDICDEMNAVKFAATAEDGAKYIEWWGWDDEFSALQAARRIRRFKA